MLYFRRIMHEVFGAVKFMHDQDIVHRDLKVSWNAFGNYTFVYLWLIHVHTKLCRISIVNTLHFILFEEG